MKHQNFSLKNRIHSFKYAFNGLKIIIKEEHNARIHLLLAILVLIAGCFFDLAVYEWISIILVIGMVIMLEIINSAIENIADFISPERNDSIKKIKDMSAAAVLIAALLAVIIGLIIFLPKILLLF